MSGAGKRRTKKPKVEKPLKNPYFLYYPQLERPERDWKGILTIASIDPGIRNFCIRIEQRIIRNGRTDKIVPLHYEKVDMKPKANEIGTTTHFEKITEYLYSLSDLLLDCNVFMMERQLGKNPQAVHVSHHALAIACIILRESKLNPIVIDIDPNLKGRMLGFKKGLSKEDLEFGGWTKDRTPDLKEWSPIVAKKLLALAQDQTSIDVINANKSKQDDLGDTVIQIEAFFKLIGLPCVLP